MKVPTTIAGLPVDHMGTCAKKNWLLYSSWFKHFVLNVVSLMRGFSKRGGVIAPTYLPLEILEPKNK